MLAIAVVVFAAEACVLVGIWCDVKLALQAWSFTQKCLQLWVLKLWSGISLRCASIFETFLNLFLLAVIILVHELTKMSVEQNIKRVRGILCNVQYCLIIK